MPVTMMDIARDLNVSVVTVSKVLRNQGKISDSTRKRVLRRAKQLNYQMNWVARSLVTRRTFTIGLLLPDFTHPFVAEIAKAGDRTPYRTRVPLCCAPAWSRDRHRRGAPARIPPCVGETSFADTASLRGYGRVHR